MAKDEKVSAETVVRDLRDAVFEVRGGGRHSFIRWDSVLIASGNDGDQSHQPVELKQARGHASSWRECLDNAVNRMEVIRPAFQARVKQGDNRLGFGIERAQIAALVTITLCAGEAEVVALSLSAVFFGDDVVDFVGKQPIMLIDLAVFAALIRAVGDFAA